MIKKFLIAVLVLIVGFLCFTYVAEAAPKNDYTKSILVQAKDVDLNLRFVIGKLHSAYYDEYATDQDLEEIFSSIDYIESTTLNLAGAVKNKKYDSDSNVKQSRWAISRANKYYLKAYNEIMATADLGDYVTFDEVIPYLSRAMEYTDAGRNELTKANRYFKKLVPNSTQILKEEVQW